MPITYTYPTRPFRNIQRGLLRESADAIFIPIIKDADGFLAYYALNAGAGEIATVSVFEDQAGTEESVRMAADWVRQNLAALLPDPPEITAGEVGAHELNLTKLGVSKVRK